MNIQHYILIGMGLIIAVMAYAYMDMRAELTALNPPDPTPIRIAPDPTVTPTIPGMPTATPEPTPTPNPVNIPTPTPTKQQRFEAYMDAYNTPTPQYIELQACLKLYAEDYCRKKHE